MPAFVGLADSWKADVWEPGHMGAAFEPVKGSELAGRFELPKGVNLDRLTSREAPRKQFDHLRSDVDNNSAIEHVDRYTRQAIEMVASGQAQRAFQLDKEDPKLRDAYGRDSIGTKAASGTSPG